MKSDKSRLGIHDLGVLGPFLDDFKLLQKRIKHSTSKCIGINLAYNFICLHTIFRQKTEFL
jgi:hypothetical protein